MTTGSTESINVKLKATRELSVDKLAEHIREVLQAWFHERRVKATEYGIVLTPYAQSLLRDRHEKSCYMQVTPVNVTEFQIVDSNGKYFIVHLNSQKCTCSVFQLDQIPCAHAIIAAW